MSPKRRITNKIVAREVLIFLGVIVLLFLFWLFLILRNSYITSKKDKKNNQIEDVISKINKLPSKDSLQHQYSMINFYVLYKYLSDTVLVSVRNEEIFKFKFPNAIRIPLTDHGIIYASKNMKILSRKSSGEKFAHEIMDELFLKDVNKQVAGRFQISNLGSLAETFFEPISFSRFLHFVQRPYYQKSLVNNYSGEEKRLLQNAINKALQITKENQLERNQLIYDKISLEAEVEQSQNKILDKPTIKSRMLIALLIISIIVYPIRLMIYAAFWAIRVLRQP